MSVKHIAITGPTSGIGRASSFALARAGAQLTLFCRDVTRGEELAREIQADGGEVCDVIHMDMADLSSVRKAADEFLSGSRPLDVLLNNAGVVNTSRKETVNGFEETFAVNHLAPFLLTGKLLPALERAPSARIVTVSSAAHGFVRDMGFDDMQAQESFKTFREYGRSKLANILFTRSLSERIRDRGMTSNCLHPGAVSTSLGTNNGVFGKVLPLLLKPFFRSPEQGAATSIYLCTSEEVEGVSGEYFSNCKQTTVKPWGRDDNAARQLWEYSEECVDFRYPL